MRSLRVLLGALLCTTAVVATACGGGNGGETTATYDEGCTESHPYGVDGQGVLQACSSGALSLAVTNTSSSVVEVSLVDPGLLASATFQPAQGNSASVVLPGQLVDGGCGTTSCTLLPGDGAVLVNAPSANVFVHILAGETLIADVARILGGYADNKLSNPFLAKSPVVACAEQLNDLRTPASFPEDEIREILDAPGPCTSAYKSIFKDSKESSTVADDLVKSLEHEVKANWLDELLQGIAKVHPR